MRDSIPCTLRPTCHCVDPEIPILDEMLHHRARFIGGSSFDQREIPSMNGSILELPLQIPLMSFMACEDEDA